ncbi:uncharacterized protein LOC135643635 isoform X1 [Musa acuminata AAA Group]|uniref:uncharacterized protein LOC135643635 isoform X1 n=1 Tax=Musa acuminata AAA Group TaxID=214697 RepID=UPI0031CDB87B
MARLTALSNRLGSACARFGLILGPLGDAMECQAPGGGYNMALWLADHHKTPSSHLHLSLGLWSRRVAATHPFHTDVSERLLLQDDSGVVLKVSPADTIRDGIRLHRPECRYRREGDSQAHAGGAGDGLGRSQDAIISKLRSSGFKEEDAEPTLLITADQVVVHGGMIREKPSSTEEAREFIKGYSAGHASTVGSVLVTNLKTGVRKGGCDKAEIYFHKIPDEVIDSLIEEGDVLYVAGGLMVEHPLTSPFVEAIVGTIDGVMGLPKALTQRLIHEALQSAI